MKILGAVVLFGLLVLAVVVFRIGGPAGFWKRFGVYSFGALVGAVLVPCLAAGASVMIGPLLIRYGEIVHVFLRQVFSVSFADAALGFLVSSALPGVVYLGMGLGAFVVWMETKDSKARKEE